MNQKILPVTKEEFCFMRDSMRGILNIMLDICLILGNDQQYDEDKHVSYDFVFFKFRMIEDKVEIVREIFDKIRGIE